MEAVNSSKRYLCFNRYCSLKNILLKEVEFSEIVISEYPSRIIMYCSGSMEGLSVETAARAGKCQISNKHFTNITSVILLVSKPTLHHVHM